MAAFICALLGLFLACLYLGAEVFAKYTHRHLLLRAKISFLSGVFFFLGLTILFQTLGL